MTNPEMKTYVDEEPTQSLKDTTPNPERRPPVNNMENPEDIEWENADWELLYKMILDDLSEAFPEISDDLTNKKVKISKWKNFLDIGKWMISISYFEGDKKWLTFSLRKTESWSYQCVKGYKENQPRYVNGEQNYAYRNDKLESEEFKKEVSAFINNPNPYKVRIG